MDTVEDMAGERMDTMEDTARGACGYSEGCGWGSRWIQWKIRLGEQMVTLEDMAGDQVVKISKSIHGRTREKMLTGAQLLVHSQKQGWGLH